jgi:riboflavin transporter FmnP
MRSLFLASTSWLENVWLVVETLKGNNITQEGIYVCIILSQIILKSMISILNIALIYILRLYCAFSNKKILNKDYTETYIPSCVMLLPFKVSTTSWLIILQHLF